MSVSWPNVVTISRLLLVFVVVMLAYGHTVWDRLLAAFFAILIIVGDWLDGHLARKLGQSTVVGSVLDIAADRILESVMWIILADLKMIPVWIPVIVISRGILTDGIRGYVLQFGFSGFGKQTLQKSKLAIFITGSPIMRTGYAVIKAFSFGWLLLLAAIGELIVKSGVISPNQLTLFLKIGYWSAIVSAIICLVRGIPVVVEGISLINKETQNA